MLLSPSSNLPHPCTTWDQQTLLLLLLLPLLLLPPHQHLLPHQPLHLLLYPQYHPHPHLPGILLRPPPQIFSFETCLSLFEWRILSSQILPPKYCSDHSSTEEQASY